jgi:hypothetical protein
MTALADRPGLKRLIPDGPLAAGGINWCRRHPPPWPPVVVSGFAILAGLWTKGAAHLAHCVFPRAHRSSGKPLTGCAACAALPP